MPVWIWMKDFVSLTRRPGKSFRPFVRSKAGLNYKRWRRRKGIFILKSSRMNITFQSGRLPD
jgi:hypothetical protein